MEPKISYVIWFTQRTGSTLLCKALESTGVSGLPYEWLRSDDLLNTYDVSTYDELQQKLWHVGSTPNGVYGLKYSYYLPHDETVLNTLKKFPGGDRYKNKPEIWENAFPNCKHIFMTRRNKIRLAVSWWKAIKTQEFHRKNGCVPKSFDLSDGYLFDAINQLVMESVFREAGIQEFFKEGGISPLTVVYEDFILNYKETVHEILEFLKIPEIGQVQIAPPYYDKLIGQ